MWSAGLITITNEEKKIALSNGLDRVTVVNRVRDFHWSVERAITEPKKRKAINSVIQSKIYKRQLRTGSEKKHFKIDYMYCI